MSPPVLTVLGDSLSSVEGRCGAWLPWPLLLQETLGSRAVVHSFGLPGVRAQGFRSSFALQPALDSQPDVLLIMLGTNDANGGLNEAGYLASMSALMHDFADHALASATDVFLLSPPPLWRDCIFGCMSMSAINERLPLLLSQLARDSGAHFVNVYRRFRDLNVSSDVSCDGCHLYPRGQRLLMHAALEALQGRYPNLRDPPPPPSTHEYPTAFVRLASLCDAGALTGGRPSECPAAGLAGTHHVAACCERSCGECGGRGCERRPGGASSCCANAILRSNRSCDAVAPPCVPSAAAAAAPLSTDAATQPLAVMRRSAADVTPAQCLALCDRTPRCTAVTADREASRCVLHASCDGPLPVAPAADAEATWYHSPASFRLDGQGPATVLRAMAADAPLLHTAFTADPAARVLDDGALYVLMSHDTDTLDEEHRGTASQFRMSDYRLLRARRPNAPLEDLGVPLTLASVPWAAGQLWAPDLSRGPDGRYHLLFPAKVRLIPSDYLSPSDPF